MGRRIACEVNGTTYASRSDACKAYDVSYSKVSEMTWDGMSVESAINALLDRGDVLGTVVKEAEDKSVVVRGKTYMHAVEVAVAFEINHLTYGLLYRKYGDAEKALDVYLERLEKNKGIEERRRQEGVQTYLYRGVEYDSREEVAEVLGISLSTLEKLVASRSYDEVGDMMDMMSLGIKKERENM